MIKVHSTRKLDFIDHICRTQLSWWELHLFYRRFTSQIWPVNSLTSYLKFLVRIKCFESRIFRELLDLRFVTFLYIYFTFTDIFPVSAPPPLTPSSPHPLLPSPPPPLTRWRQKHYISLNRIRIRELRTEHNSRMLCFSSLSSKTFFYSFVRNIVNLLRLFR